MEVVSTTYTLVALSLGCSLTVGWGGAQVTSSLVCSSTSGGGGAQTVCSTLARATLVILSLVCSSTSGGGGVWLISVALVALLLICSSTVGGGGAQITLLASFWVGRGWVSYCLGYHNGGLVTRLLINFRSGWCITNFCNFWRGWCTTSLFYNCWQCINFW